MRQFIQDLAEKNHNQATHLLQILREVQSHYHYIPEEAIEQIAELLNIPRTQIIGVVEFYSFFHLTPRGQYELFISDSITDHMLGKQSLIAYLSERLNVAVGRRRKSKQTT